MYSNNDYRNYLAHHGVVGMKWALERAFYEEAPLMWHGKILGQHINSCLQLLEGDDNVLFRE